MQTLTAEALREKIEVSGHFREVRVLDEEGFRFVSVVEYPLISSWNVEGWTVQSREWLARFLGLCRGGPYNRTVLAGRVEKFLELLRNQGYTQISIKSIRIDDLGRVEVEVDEGRLTRIDVDPPVISQRIAGKFFAKSLNRPFYTPEIKRSLEELLYTQVFFSLHSEVKREENGVLLKVKPDVKSLHSFNWKFSYSGLGGFDLHSRFSFIRKNDKLQFFVPRLDLLLNTDRTFTRFSWEEFDFRRYLKKSHFFWRATVAYEHPRGSGLHLGGGEILAAYKVSTSPGLVITARILSGWLSSYEEENPRFFVEPGIGVSWERRGALDIYGALLEAEWGWNPLRANTRCFARIHLHWKPGNWKLEGAGFLRNLQGNGGHAREYRFLDEDRFWVPLPMLFTSRNLGMAGVQLEMPRLWRLLKPGVFLQYLKGEEEAVPAGVHLLIHLQRFPLAFRFFLVRRVPHLLFGTSFSIE